MKSFGQRIIDIYEKFEVDLPGAKDISGRLLEETIELVLETGAANSQIYDHIADAVSNEAAKRKIYPSEIRTKWNSEKVIKEIADVYILLGFLIESQNLSEEEILKAIEKKLEHLESSDLVFSEKRLFYRNRGIKE